MRHVLPVSFALALACTATLSAAPQGANPANNQPGAAPEMLLAQRQSTQVATPIPIEPARKKGFFERVFGGGRERAAATPAPAPPKATPAPATPRPRPKRRATSESREDQEPEKKETTPPKPAPDKEDEKPAVSEASTKKPAGKSKASAKAAAEKKDDEADAAPKVELTKEQQAVKAAEESGDAMAIEKARYDEVRSRAVQDEKILALKEKADDATTEEEGRKALRAYNKALFQKMRTLDSSIRDRVDMMEDAVMKRLEPPAGGQ